MKELLYIDNEEWLAQSLKVKQIERKLSELEDFRRNLESRGGRDEALNGRIYSTRYRLKVNKEYLESIELKIEREYNLKAMELVSDCCLDDDYYSRVFERDGFIRGFKL